MNQQFEGTTPYSFTFTGAFSFGESRRTNWVNPDPVTDKQCDKFKKHQATVNQKLSRIGSGSNSTEKLDVADPEKFQSELELFKSTRPRQRSTNMPQDERFKSPENANPPVGTYNIHPAVIVDQFTISKEDEVRQKFTIQTSFGQFRPKNEEEAKDRDKKRARWGNPPELKEYKSEIGPGKYCPKIQGRTQPPISFGYKESTEWAKDGPSPDTYYNQTFSGFRTTTSWMSFKKRKNFGGAPKLVLPNSIDLGPGQYHPKDVYTGPSKTFPKSERDGFKGSSVPAPGAYDGQQENIEKTLQQHQKDIQKKLDKKQENEQKAKRAEDELQRKAESMGRTYIPRSQRSHLAQFSNPGPGAYNPKLYNSVKDISMPKDKRKNMVSSEDIMKPGPGAHFLDKPGEDQENAYPQCQFGMGLSQRPNPNSEEKLNKYRVPSPTRYDLKSTLNGPKFSMRLKNERLNLNANPGPGTYEPDAQVEPQVKPPYHYTVPQTPAPLIGRGARSDPVLSKFRNIGPGSYQCSTASSGSRMSMPKAARFQELEKEDVGPGYYKIPTTIGLIPRYHFEKNKERLEGGSGFSTLKK